MAASTAMFHEPLAGGSTIKRPAEVFAAKVQSQQVVQAAERRHFRRSAGETNRLDREAEAFHARVREGYLRVAAEEPERFVIIDGTQPEARVFAQLWAAVQALLP